MSQQFILLSVVSKTAGLCKQGLLKSVYFTSKVLYFSRALLGGWGGRCTCRSSAAQLGSPWRWLGSARRAGGGTRPPGRGCCSSPGRLGGTQTSFLWGQNWSWHLCQEVGDIQGTACSVPVGKGGLNPCSGLQGGGKPSGMRPLGVRGILWCGDEMKLVKALEDEDSQRLGYLSLRWLSYRLDWLAINVGV